jgi:hypothetical protein
MVSPSYTSTGYFVGNYLCELAIPSSEILDSGVLASPLPLWFPSGSAPAPLHLPSGSPSPRIGKRGWGMRASRLPLLATVYTEVRLS